MNNNTSNNTQSATKYTKVGFNNTPTKTKKPTSEILNSNDTNNANSSNSN